LETAVRKGRFETGPYESRGETFEVTISLSSLAEVLDVPSMFFVLSERKLRNMQVFDNYIMEVLLDNR